MYFNALLILLILVLFVQIYKWFIYKKNESFDNNCINTIKPSFSLKISDYFNFDASGNIQLDNTGNVDINSLRDLLLWL